MKYYNQFNYAKIPYPAAGFQKATVKSGGCGVCCASMIVENLTGEAFPPQASASYSLSHGARVFGGTDMKRLSSCIKRDFGLAHSQTNDEHALISCLKSGGMAIALVDGDRKNYKGIFSNSGHYIVIAASNNNQLTILDPAKYYGKFSKTGRKGKVTVKGDLCFCSLSTIIEETLYKSPKFYLFNKKKDLKEKDDNMKIYKTIHDVPVWGRETIEMLIKKGALEGADGQLNISEDLVRTFVILNRLGKL